MERDQAERLLKSLEEIKSTLVTIAQSLGVIARNSGKPYEK